MILLNQLSYLRRNRRPIKPYHQQLTLIGIRPIRPERNKQTYQRSVEVIPYRTQLLLAHRDLSGGVNMQEAAVTTLLSESGPDH